MLIISQNCLVFFGKSNLELVLLDNGLPSAKTAWEPIFFWIVRITWSLVYLGGASQFSARVPKTAIPDPAERGGAR